MARPQTRVTRWASHLLFAAGGVCLGLAFLGWAEAAVFQWVLDWRLERALNEGAGSPVPSSSFSEPGTPSSDSLPPPSASAGEPRAPKPAQPLALLPGGPSPAGRDGSAGAASESPIGRLTARRLGLAAVVAEGISARTLRRAVGHIPGTALPWEEGTVGLAAHRDTFFYRLKDVKVGDTFELTTPRGRFEYVVRSLDIVAPDRADLLDAKGTARLALVTCYPFSVVGPAPSRFVVTAERVEAPQPRGRAALWTPVSRTGP